VTGREVPGRWRVVGALFVVVACVATSVSAFGVFLPVLADTFGWSRGAIAVALSINLGLGGIAAFPVGRAADRHGPRGVLVLTVLIGGAGFALTSAIGALWQFYLVYGVMVGVGMSSIYVLSTATVSRWFVARRGLALAIVLSGFNLGWLLGGPVAAFLIERIGWRSAYLALGAIVAGIGGPAALAVRYPPGALAPAGPRSAEARAGTSLRHALGARQLWQLVGSWFAIGFVFMMVTVHSVPLARDLGLPLEHAAFMLTAYGLGAGVGRLAAGAAADRLGAVAIMRACLALQAIALALLVAGPPPWALTVVLVAFGVGASGADNAFVKRVPEVFGVGALATVMSVLGLGWRTGAALGPAGAGFVYDATGSYTIPFAAGLVALGAGALLFSLGSRPRSVGS
jgi:MFS family permease